MAGRAVAEPEEPQRPAPALQVGHAAREGPRVLPLPQDGRHGELVRAGTKGLFECIRWCFGIFKMYCCIFWDWVSAIVVLPADTILAVRVATLSILGDFWEIP